MRGKPILFLLVMNWSLLFGLEPFIPDLDKDVLIDPEQSHLDKLYNPQKSDRDFVYHLTRTYAPEAYYILYRISHTTDTFNVSRDFMIWTGDIHKRPAREMQVIVHESTHAYIALHNYKYAGILEKGASLPGGTGSSAALIDEPGRSYLVYYTKTFTTREMAPEVPMTDRGLYQLYDLYIKEGQVEFGGQKMDIGSQTFGIYGLLDEFNAYWRGHEASYALRSWYLDREVGLKSKEEIADLWIEFFDDVDMNTAAFEEFKIFILTYLLYAEKKYPEIYRNIMDNRSFARAFIMAEAGYREVREQFFAFKKSKLAELNRLDIKAREKGNRLEILGRTLTTDYDRPAKLAPLLEQPEYLRMFGLLKELAR